MGKLIDLDDYRKSKLKHLPEKVEDYSFKDWQDVIEWQRRAWGIPKQKEGIFTDICE